MSLPKPWHEIGQHAMLPQLTHDELVRFDMVAQLNSFAAQRLAPRVRTAYETRIVNAWRMRHGRTPQDRHEVAEALAPDADYRSWSLVRRNTMEMRQHAGRRVMLRQARQLRDRAAALNAGASTLQLDDSLPIPRYVSAVDTHLMPGGYAAEHLQGDVVNPANYDA
ncbi:MAG: SAM-dependent methyltransferase, partial [Gammaproteobacteria bacterium]|nr:SAM-dependent methyltransferase [Gammaproteobacteria bacterium]